MNIPHTPILIGEASDAAFATRFRQAISSARHNHLPRINYPTDERLLALSDIDCPWPFPSRARLLVNVALKYVTRCYHIVRRSQILEGLEQTIQNPHSSDSLLKSKLWALFAIGEMYSTRTAAAESNFPGMGYFARATRVLRIISERPRIDAVEIRLLLVCSPQCLVVSTNHLFAVFLLTCIEPSLHGVRIGRIFRATVRRHGLASQRPRIPAQRPECERAPKSCLVDRLQF